MGGNYDILSRDIEWPFMAYCAVCGPAQWPHLCNKMEGAMRKFESGATRDVAGNKLDYEGFLSPQVLELYAKYMNKNRVQADGNVRDSDNWQKGIPRDVYMKSMHRHFMDAWMLHRGIEVFKKNADGETVFNSETGQPIPMTLEEALCAQLFNVMGYLFELEQGR